MAKSPTSFLSTQAITLRLVRVPGRYNNIKEIHVTDMQNCNFDQLRLIDVFTF